MNKEVMIIMVTSCLDNLLFNVWLWTIKMLVDFASANPVSRRHVDLEFHGDHTKLRLPCD